MTNIESLIKCNREEATPYFQCYDDYRIRCLWENLDRKKIEEIINLLFNASNQLDMKVLKGLIDYLIFGFSTSIIER